MCYSERIQTIESGKTMQDEKINRRRKKHKPALLPLIVGLALLLGLVGFGRAWIKPISREIPERVKAMTTHISGKLPKEVQALGESNPDAKDFVEGYSEYYGTHQTIDLSNEAETGEVPLLLQWDKRWGYETYGSGVIGITGCGPTCLSMVAIGLTGDASCDPLTVANYSAKHGYYSKGSGTSWTLMSEGSSHFGLTAQELPLDQRRMEQALEEGCPIILAMGPGDFTTSGHYIVLTGCDEQGFCVHDPNSPTRSGQKWSYETISGQIRNIWAFRKSEP